MNSLILLKDRIQKILNESIKSESFREALSDGLYACDLSVIALDQWIGQWANWRTENVVNRNDDHNYLDGVQFVSDAWQEIKRNAEE